MDSILEARKHWYYRLLEGLLGYTSLGFLLLIFLASIIAPVIVSVFLIIYSFLWVLKFSLNAIYTTFSYRQSRRWEEINWPQLFHNLSTDFPEAKNILQSFADKYQDKIGWQEKIEEEIKILDKNQASKFQPEAIFHICIFSIYNESTEVLLKSLKAVLTSEYPLDKLLVVVSQEARNGQESNLQTREKAQDEAWLNICLSFETDLETVYNPNHETLAYQNPVFADFKLTPDKLNVVFTQHPDGLIGEIKGKASNEDWGARQASLMIKAKNIDPELCLITSLDADSQVTPYFFHNLSYKYCTVEDRLQCGFQPIHVYSNNFFETGVWPRQVATTNTLTNMLNLGVEGETELFAIYSLPLIVVQKVNFWVREVIAEDFMMYTKCLVHFQGHFRVVPFFGVFEGDPVYAEDYLEAIANQYKQLQRWSWGGVESFPYIFTRFFIDKQSGKIDLRIRLRQTFLLFIKHVSWSSSPFVFSLGIIFPQLIGNLLHTDYEQTQAYSNLVIFAQVFTWISLLAIPIFAYITFQYISRRALKNRPLNLYEKFLVLSQFLVFPFLYTFMGFPAMDSQIRGILGKYLGYWVTPKK